VIHSKLGEAIKPKYLMKSTGIEKGLRGVQDGIAYFGEGEIKMEPSLLELSSQPYYEKNKELFNSKPNKDNYSNIFHFQDYFLKEHNVNKEINNDKTIS